MTGMENEWRLYVRDGDRFLETAVAASRKRKDVFTPEILYNIVSMAIEKHIMGFLLYHNRLPDNHTLSDLADAVGLVCEFDGRLSARIVEMDRFQNICALSDYFRETPGESDVREFLEIGGQVRDFVEKNLPPLSKN
jgi:hypothetical protein